MLKTDDHPLILYKYFTKDIFKYFLFALLSLIILIFFIDIIELFRRSSNKVGVDHLIEADIFDILVMAILKISGNVQKILPFAALIGSISCFNQWRKKNYYIVSKTSGISLWTILSPILVSFFLIGLVSIIVLNPFTALLDKKYENLQTVFFGQKNLKTFSFDTKGFWIKQISRKSYLLINAGKINEDLNTLFDVNIFVYDQDQVFKKRISARRAVFSKNKLNLFEVRLTKNNSELEILNQLSFFIKSNQSNLNVTSIEPENIYILDFPIYLKQMQQYGLNTSKHLLYFFKLICQPFLIISMILLSASLMLRNNERKIEFGIVSLSLVVGFSLYFIGDFIFALGSSEKLPPLLSGFGPTLIGLFAGCYLTSDIDEGKRQQNKGLQ